MLEMKIITNWQFYFEGKDGIDNKFNAISSFSNFWNIFGEKMLVVSEKFVIGGNLINGLDDIGERENIFFTSRIAAIERVKHQFKGDLSHDLFRAVTDTGEEYYFFSDEHTPEMKIMIGEMLSAHQLPAYSAFCPQPDIPGKYFI